MKIGYFIGKFPYQNPVQNYRYGGGEVVAYNLAINMAKRGHEVHIFTTSANRKESTEHYEGLIIHRYSTIAKPLERNLSFSLMYKPLKHSIDVVHVHITSSPFELISALLYSWTKRKPLIVTYHGDVVPLQSGLIYHGSVWVYNFMVKKVLDHANVIISPSQFYIGESKFLKQYKDKIISIPNGINIESFEIPYSREECRKKLGLPTNRNIILFLSVLHPKKGPHILLKAIPEIIKEYKNVLFVFVGGGKVEEYRKLAEQLGVQKYVKFTGYIEEKLKPLYYKAADVFVLPSIESVESFGIVNLEAMACGVPIVASRIGGISDVVKDGKNGLLVPPKDPYKLADAIVYLLENEEVRKKMGKIGRDIVKNYLWNKIAEKVEKVYKEVMEKQ